jgi:hypothetical protein
MPDFSIDPVKVSVDYDLSDEEKERFLTNEQKLKKILLEENVVFENSTVAQVLSFFQNFAHEKDNSLVFPSKELSYDLAVDYLGFDAGTNLSDVRDYLNSNFAV